MTINYADPFLLVLLTTSSETVNHRQNFKLQTKRPRLMCIEAILFGIWALNSRSRIPGCKMHKALHPKVRPEQ